MNKARARRNPASPVPPIICFAAIGLLGVFGAWEYLKNVPETVEKSEVEAPLSTLVVFKEAESCEFKGKIVFDPAASNSSSIQAENPEASLSVSCLVPASARSVNIWIRSKGGAVSVTAPKDVIAPNFAKQAGDADQLAWRMVGKLNPSASPTTVKFQETDPSASSAEIDCILFTDQVSENKDSFLTSMEPLEVDLSFTVSDFKSSSKAWGINVSPAMTIENGNSFEVVRFSLEDWDEDSFRKKIGDLLRLGDSSRILIHFPNWPESMDADGDGLLDQQSMDDYFDLIGRFAKIALEDQNAAGQVWFEFFDDSEQAYYTDFIENKKPHNVAELARIFLRAASRIREISSTVKVGGTASGLSEDTDFHDQFISITAPALDFYSVKADAGGLPENLLTISGYLKENSTARAIPLIVSESRPQTEKVDVVSAAFFLFQNFAGGADSTMVFDNSVAGTNDEFQLLFQILNAKFSDVCAVFSSSEPANLIGLTSRDNESLLLVYRGSRAREVVLPPGKWEGFVWESGATTLEGVTVSGQFQIPGTSMLYLEPLR